MLEKPMPRLEKASWIATIIGVILALIGLIYTVFKSPKPSTPPQQNVDNRSVIGDTYINNTHSPVKAPKPGNKTRQPLNVLGQNANGYPTRFATGQKLIGAEWLVDGAPVAPAKPPTIYTTTLNLAKGTRRITASSRFEVCSIIISVPVAKVDQDVLLDCKDRSSE